MRQMQAPPLRQFSEGAGHGASRCIRLTVKLRGRAREPDWSRGRTLSFSARGDVTERHGPLQRLLERGYPFGHHWASHGIPS